MKAESFGYDKQPRQEDLQQQRLTFQQSLGEREDDGRQGGGDPESGGIRRHSVEQAQGGACEHWTSDKEHGDEPNIEATWCAGVTRQAVREQSRRKRKAQGEQGDKRKAQAEQSDERKAQAEQRRQRKGEADQIHEREARGGRRLGYRQSLGYERQPSSGDAYGLGVKRTEPRDDRQGSDRRTRRRGRARSGQAARQSTVPAS